MVAFSFEHPEPTGIVAFGFSSWHEAFSERVIGGIAAEHARGTIPIYTQKGVVLPTTCTVTRIDNDAPDAERPPPTLRIARGAVAWATQRHIARLVVVAATPHMWRAIRDLKFAIAESNARIAVCWSEIADIEHAWWFDQRSRTWWTRSVLQWSVYDRLIRLMPMRLYIRIAK